MRRPAIAKRRRCRDCGGGLTMHDFVLCRRCQLHRGGGVEELGEGLAVTAQPREDAAPVLSSDGWSRVVFA